LQIKASKKRLNKIAPLFTQNLIIIFLLFYPMEITIRDKNLLFFSLESTIIRFEEEIKKEKKTKK